MVDFGVCPGGDLGVDLGRSGVIRLPPSTETKKAKSPKLVKNWFLHRPNQVVKKWSNGGFWPSQMMTPKSGEKVVKKLSNGGPSKIWDQKNGKNMP